MPRLGHVGRLGRGAVVAVGGAGVLGDQDAVKFDGAKAAVEAAVMGSRPHVAIPFVCKELDS